MTFYNPRGKVKSMNKLKKVRWRNILRKAAKANRLLKKGYIVFDHYGHIFKGFKFDEGMLYEGDSRCKVVWVSKNGWSGALDVSIKKFNADNFDKWKAIHPKHIKKL